MQMRSRLSPHAAQLQILLHCRRSWWRFERRYSSTVHRGAPMLLLLTKWVIDVKKKKRRKRERREESGSWRRRRRGEKALPLLRSSTRFRNLITYRNEHLCLRSSLFICLSSFCLVYIFFLRPQRIGFSIFDFCVWSRNSLPRIDDWVAEMKW